MESFALVAVLVSQWNYQRLDSLRRLLGCPLLFLLQPVQLYVCFDADETKSQSAQFGGFRHGPVRHWGSWLRPAPRIKRRIQSLCTYSKTDFRVGWRTRGRLRASLRRSSRTPARWGRHQVAPRRLSDFCRVLHGSLNNMPPVLGKEWARFYTRYSPRLLGYRAYPHGQRLPIYLVQVRLRALHHLALHLHFGYSHFDRNSYVRQCTEVDSHTDTPIHSLPLLLHKLPHPNLPTILLAWPEVYAWARFWQLLVSHRCTIPGCFLLHQANSREVE